MKIRTKATIATLILSAILYWVFPSGHIGLPIAEITVGILSVGIIWIVCYAAFSPTSYKKQINMEETFKRINETLDRIEARIDQTNEMLSKIVAEIDKHNKPMTFQTDGEIMFYDRWKSLTTEIKSKINKKSTKKEDLEDHYELGGEG